MKNNDEITAIDELFGELLKRGVTNRDIRLQLGISDSYVSKMKHGACAMDADTFAYLCGMAGLNPKDMRRRFPLDFGKNGGIPAIGWRTRDWKQAEESYRKQREEVQEEQ